MLNDLCNLQMQSIKETGLTSAASYRPGQCRHIYQHKQPSGRVVWLTGRPHEALPPQYPQSWMPDSERTLNVVVPDSRRGSRWSEHGCELPVYPTCTSTHQETKLSLISVPLLDTLKPILARNISERKFNSSINLPGGSNPTVYTYIGGIVKQQFTSLWWLVPHSVKHGSG